MDHNLCNSKFWNQWYGMSVRAVARLLKLSLATMAEKSFRKIGSEEEKSIKVLQESRREWQWKWSKRMKAKII